jgi:hypothetical protein
MGDLRKAVARLLHIWWLAPLSLEIVPQRYLTSVLSRLPALMPSKLGKLLPDVWKRADIDVAAT